MEVSDLKCDSSDSAQKNKSLDIKSVYVDKSALDKAEKGVKKKILSQFDDSRGKRQRKEASLSYFGPEVTESRRNRTHLSTQKPNAFNYSAETRSLSDGLQNGHGDSALDLFKDNSNGFLSDGMVIPKKPRGICRHKKADKTDDDHDCKNNYETCTNDLSANTEDVNDESCTDIASPSHVCEDNNVGSPSQVFGCDAKNDDKDVPSINETSPSKLSHNEIKKILTDVKDRLANGASSPPSQMSKDNNKKKKLTNFKNESSGNVASHSQVSNGLIKKKSTNAHVHRRRKSSTTLVREDHIDKATPLFDNGEQFYGDNLEEDLEQNAARMLSSRFETNFTGFLGNPIPSMSHTANGFHGNFNDEKLSSSADDLSRMLRPRKQSGKSVVRKRRHFYEVSYKDMDPYCMLKQRIRVYWPLDKSWYFGLITDYDPKTRLHHVKYDDRDEEWINLQYERFKLLLFPSEISGKFKSRKSRAKMNQEIREGDTNASGSSSGNYKESVPLITWLPTSKQRRKLSSGSKKKRRVQESGEALMDKSSNNSFNDRELSFVYFRKKFHKRREGLDEELEHDFIHGSSAASINILASVADSALVLEELNGFGLLIEAKQVTLKFNFHLHHFHDLTFGNESTIYRALYLLQFGKLVNISPMVHMEIVLVDNVTGLKLYVFEGSLKSAVVLLCLIIRSFGGQSKRSKFDKMQVPCTSIGISLSGIFLFLLYRFLEMDSSKLTYLENKLRSHCVTIREVPVAECTFSTIKELQKDSGQMLCTSMCKDAVSFESFPDKVINLDTVPTVSSTNEISAKLSYSHSFDMSYHIKSLIENNASSGNFENHKSSSKDSPDTRDKLTSEDPSDPVSDITMENLGSSLDQIVASSKIRSANYLKVETDALSVNNDGDWITSTHNEKNINGNSRDNQDMELNRSDETVVQDAEKSSSSYPEGYSSPEKSEGGYISYLNNSDNNKAKIQAAGQMEEQSIDKEFSSPNPTAPRSIRRNIQSSISPKYGHHLKSWNEEFACNGFLSGNRKPRTQVSYSLPFGGYDLGAKRRSHQRKPRPYKKISSFNAHNLLDPLTCNANVLVISMEKGWRDCGAQIMLESDDQKDWKVSVKILGVTKYSYKAQHVLQPGITNRYTHAMMWKGGKDWTLEFTDRNQWFVFKEIYEECRNRNMRASYVKNIPIPGVRLIESDDDDLIGVPFVHSSYAYHRQVGTEVDMALDPAYVLYDMDTDDEMWVSRMRTSIDKKENGFSEISDEIFQRVIDIFEKFAYAQQCDEFSEDEIEEFVDDVGSPENFKTIYEYWRQKRVKKGMPLIRQFQPALWERYQKQLKEWESSMSMQGLRNGCTIKKPPMFAFCLRPRGLEVPNKLLKQRSHKKFASTGCHRSFAREQSSRHTSGRRTNGLNAERISISSYESSDSYNSNDDSDRFHYPEHTTNSKKRSRHTPPRDSLTMMPFSQNKKLKKNEIYETSPNMSQIQRDGLRRHRTNINEFKLRDASNLANHASNIAKMKREKARYMMHKANLAIHKATAALMMAEAMKDSERHFIDNYEDYDDDGSADDDGDSDDVGCDEDEDEDEDDI